MHPNGHRRIRAIGCTIAPLVAALMLLAGVAPEAGAQTEAKLGYVNSEQLFQDYRGFADAEAAYEQELSGWLRELQRREQELADLEAEFRAQEPMLSEERRREMEEEFRRGTQEYEEFRRSIFGQGGRAQTRNQELLEPVLAEVQRAVEEIAEEDQYDLIFDAVDGNIIYGSEAYDITDRVLDKLRELAGDTTTPPSETDDEAGGAPPND